MKHRKNTLLILFLVLGILSFLSPALFAPGQTTSMSVTPSHVAEGSTTKIVLTLSGYTSSQKLYFIVNVTQPDASNSAINKTGQVDSSGNGVFTILYSTDFTLGSKAWTNLTGTYTATVTATNGAFPSGPVSFTVGPTDKLAYQRTQKIVIRANGYLPNHEVTVNITGPAATGFPHFRVKVDSTGFVNDLWTIPPSQTTGNYFVQVLGGSNLTKSIVDTQTVRVTLAILKITTLNAATGTGTPVTGLIRGNTTFVVFNITYPDGSVVTSATGTSVVNLTNPSNAVVSTLVGAYDSSKKEYLTTSSYTFPINAPLGSWQLRMNVNTTTDTYGNIGPFSANSTSVSLATLSLKTSIMALKTSYNRTITFSVNSTVSYPTSDQFTGSSGIVFANLTSGTRMLEQNLTYSSVTGKWIGTITVPPDYPLGVATLQVSAHDHYGNTGSDTSLHITITPTTIIVRQVPFNINGTGTFQPFQTFAIQINATYINNQTLLQGPGGIGRVTFRLPGGGSISLALTLQSNHTLTGQYTIGDNDPLGTWNLTLAAGQLNDGYGNTNTKSILGPIIKVLSLPLTFDSSLVPSTIVTGDKATMGVAFRYPNGNFAQNLYVNGTVLVNGQNMTFTFAFDTGTQKYLARIDTTGWAPGQYQLNIYASTADYRGYHAIAFNLQAAPFPVGPIIGAVLIVIALGLGFLEYTRRKVPPE